MLGSIFSEMDDSEMVSLDENEGAGDSLEDTGLDAEHYKLYEHLVSQEKWTREAVIALCKPLNLMIDGALETINEWAFELVDEAVLEDEGDIYVRLDISKDIANQPG
jgi:hypothetical protein